MKISNATWASWLNHHSSYAYNAHLTRVKDICSAQDPFTNFENLTSSKNIFLLMKALMGENTKQLSGIPLLEFWSYQMIFIT